jgi:hypothetical protein
VLKEGGKEGRKEGTKGREGGREGKLGGEGTIGGGRYDKCGRKQGRKEEGKKGRKARK